MKKVNDLEVDIGDKTYVIEIKSEKQKLKDKKYKPDVWYDDEHGKQITETRSFWEDPSFIKLLTEDANVKKLVIDNFGSLDIAVKEIKKYKPIDKLAQAMGEVRKATRPLKETLDKINMPQAVIDKLYPKMKGFKEGEIEYKTKDGKTVVRRGLFPKDHIDKIIPKVLKGMNKEFEGTFLEEVGTDIMFAKLTANKAELSKKYGKPFDDAYESYKKGQGKKSRNEMAISIKKQRKEELKASIKKKMVSSTVISEGKIRTKPATFMGSLGRLLHKERKIDNLATLDLATHLKGTKASKKAPYIRRPITGTGLQSYMDRQKPPLKTPVDIIKAYKKDKSLVVKTWENLVWNLRQMNYEPDEVFNYALTAVSNTKERWNEHRIFREIEKNESGAGDDMCRYYKTHLKAKLPLKSLYHSDFLKDWCVNNDIWFSSEENLRVNLKKMIRGWNKKYPNDKIREKLKKKP